jgi:ubiquinone/menaquinone biosynthesis C-methylase UbiE
MVPGYDRAKNARAQELYRMTTSSSTFMATDGDGYELTMGRWSRRLALPFLDFAGTKDGETVLDVGCGTGSLAFALTKRCPRSSVRGVDFSSAYVDHARKKNRDPGVAFEVGDACALSFPDRSFDRVLSLLMLHFVPKADLAVAEMRRVARPGATVAAAVWDARGGLVANRILFDTAAALDPRANARRARNFTRPMTRPGELAKAWTTAGFVDVEQTSLTIRMEFASFDDYWRPHTGKEGPTAEYVASLTDPERAKFRETLRLAYLDGEDDGPRSYAASAWAVKGRTP